MEEDIFCTDHYIETFRINLQNDCDLKLSKNCIEKVLSFY